MLSEAYYYELFRFLFLCCILLEINLASAAAAVAAVAAAATTTNLSNKLDDVPASFMCPEPSSNF